MMYLADCGKFLNGRIGTHLTCCISCCLQPLQREITDYRPKIVEVNKVGSSLDNLVRDISQPLDSRRHYWSSQIGATLQTDWTPEKTKSRTKSGRDDTDTSLLGRSTDTNCTDTNFTDTNCTSTNYTDTSVHTPTTNTQVYRYQPNRHQLYRHKLYRHQVYIHQLQTPKCTDTNQTDTNCTDTNYTDTKCTDTKCRDTNYRAPSVHTPPIQTPSIQTPRTLRSESWHTRWSNTVITY